VVAYTLLGTTWLIMKSEGALQQRMRELTRHTLLALLAVIAVVSVWTPLGWRPLLNAGLPCLISTGLCRSPFWYSSLACGSGA
jgi:cytochrome bd-type quinol oxidase subunit 2